MKFESFYTLIIRKPIPHVVQYILVDYFIPYSLYLLIPYTYIAPHSHW